MVVQFRDEITANKVKRAMYAAGCFKCRVHLGWGKYGKTGDKKKDREVSESLENLPYGRPSSTKEERDAARKKKEYKTGQTFNRKTTYQNLKNEREVDFAHLSEKYTKVVKDAVKVLVKKPKTISNKAPGKGNEDENDQENDKELKDDDLFNPDWFIGDHCRVKCAFDGLEHEAKLLEQDQNNPLVFKLQILGYGVKEKINCSLFKKSRGKNAQIAQLSSTTVNPKITEKSSFVMNFNIEILFLRVLYCGYWLWAWQISGYCVYNWDQP